ncbi:MAG: homocysteine S-methyltransferase family protein [Myxococcales bacterium]|nr:homocysteine S-methyltransferase family protein [Myxococcales bacterium]
MVSVHAQQSLPVLLDGAMGSALALAGVRIEGPAWSSRAVVEAPEEVAKLHAAYAAAGAVVHTANTFRTTPSALEAWSGAPPGLTARAWVAEAVRIAREAVPVGHRVAGSLAPLDDCYARTPPKPDARRLHREQAERLAEAGVDLFLCETFVVPEEALIAVDAARTTGLPVWVSLTAGPAGDLLGPDAIARFAREAADHGAQTVLVNCSPASLMVRLLEPLSRAGVAFGAYANVGSAAEGLGALVDWGEPRPGVEELATRAAKYAAFAEAWVALGASVVGGCCGTTPAHIQAMSARFACHKSPSHLH